MAKFQITVEDNGDGVSISVDNHQTNSTKAGFVAAAMLQSVRMIARIPLEGTANHFGCTCEICQAMREKIALKPTIH